MGLAIRQIELAPPQRSLPVDYTQPAFYENFHTTDVFQGEIQATINRRAMIHNVGIEAGQDNISSNNLGNHRRLRSGLFYENQIVTHSPLLVSGGAVAYYYSDGGWSCWPGIDLGYQLSRRLRWAASIGRSFRVPTSVSYTHLTLPTIYSV